MLLFVVFSRLIVVLFYIMSFVYNWVVYYTLYLMLLDFPVGLLFIGLGLGLFRLFGFAEVGLLLLDLFTWIYCVCVTGLRMRCGFVRGIDLWVVPDFRCLIVTLS